MLLSDFTWLHFFAIATFLTVLWYTGVLLLFFREEIKGAFGLKPRETKPPKSEPPTAHHDPDNVMGETKAPEGMTETYEINFAAPHRRERQLGLVPDFLKEISEIVEITQKENGTKQDLLGMLEELKETYPDITSVENWDSLVVHIKDSSPFPITEDEIKNLFR